MRDAMRVARSELALQLRSRGLLISVVVTMAIVVALVGAPQLLDSDESYGVGLVGDESEPLAEPLVALADGSGIEVELGRPDDEAAARQSLEGGDIDAAVVDGRVVLSDGGTEQRLSGLIQGAHEAVELTGRLAALDLTEQEIGRTLSVDPLPEQSIASGDQYESAREGLAFIIMMVLLFLFMSTTVALAVGVVEEKSSRIVEILLVALKPWQLLSGKLVAFGVIGLIQLVAVGVAGIAAAHTFGIADDLPPGTAQIILVTFVGYLFGYLFFGAMAAALASLVSRQEETNGVLTPMTLATVLSFLAAYIASSAPEMTISTVLTVAPPTSSIALPVQLAAGNAAAWHVVLAVVLMVLAIAGVVALGGRVYERSVLRIGARVRLADAIRGEAGLEPAGDRT